MHQSKRLHHQRSVYRTCIHVSLKTASKHGYSQLGGCFMPASYPGSLFASTTQEVGAGKSERIVKRAWYMYMYMYDSVHSTCTCKISVGPT